MSTLLESHPLPAPRRASKPKKIWTDAEIRALPDDGNKYEVVDGELVTMPPAFPEHGARTNALSCRVSVYVLDRKLGLCYDNQSGFRMKGGNLRSPDFSFISSERLKSIKREPRSYNYGGAPDLCAEVLSDERPSYIKKKLNDYFESGARLVWWLDQVTKTVRVYHDALNFKLLTLGDTLDGEDVVPGFKISLKKLFEE